jgi:hypothetical protein
MVKVLRGAMRRTQPDLHCAMPPVSHGGALVACRPG